MVNFYPTILYLIWMFYYYSLYSEMVLLYSLKIKVNKNKFKIFIIIITIDIFITKFCKIE